MAVTGSQKQGVKIERTRSVERRAMSTAALRDQADLLGVSAGESVLGDWPLTGPENPESVVPDDDELRALAPSEEVLRELRKGQE